MRNTIQLNRVLSASACAIALFWGGAALAQVAAPAAPPAASSAPETKAAPSASPQVAFSARLVEAASAFESYTRNASAIQADFRDGAAIRTALQTGSTFETEQLAAGQVAYAAIVALQDPEFVDGVRRLAGDPSVADTLLNQPYSVSRIAGSEGAASLVSAALRARGGKLMASGRAVKQSAYDIQHQSWSLQAVPDAASVLQQSKALSLVRFKAAPEDTGLLIKTALEAAGGDRTTGGAALNAPVVQRALALAALAVLGKAGDGAEDPLRPLLAEANSVQCLKMSKLNLYQCLSVAGPHYEDVFCLGQHAMMETAQCVMDSAGKTPAPAPVTLASNASFGSASATQPSLIPVAATRIVAQSK